jgi:hypothetical protein
VRAHVCILASLLLGVTVSSLVSAPALAVEDTRTTQWRRGRAAAWAGPSLARGSLDFEAPTALVRTRIDGVPSVSLGADVWPLETVGFRLAADLGLGAELEVPGAKETLRFNRHTVEGLARYRFFLDARSDALAVLVGTGVRVERQDVRAQEPALLVDRLIAGPLMTVALDAPLLEGDLVLRTEGFVTLPFFVQESPRDSGDPQGFFGWGVRAELTWRLLGPWGLAAALEWSQVRVDFEGEGTRANGTPESSTNDTFLRGRLGALLAF